MNDAPLNPADVSARLLVLRFIHLSLVAGIVMFGVVAYVSAQGRIVREPAIQDPACQAAAALCGLSVLLAANLHRFFFRPLAAPMGLAEAFRRYNVFFLMRAAIIEGGAMFAAAVAFLTHNILPFALLAFGVAALAFYRPSRAEFERLTGSGESQQWQ